MQTAALPVEGPRPAIRAGIAALALVPATVLMGLSWPFDVDDAYILFRYGRHLAEGHGLAWNPGAAPVEGYTNLLYVVGAAGLHLLGVAPMPVAKVAGAIAGQLCLLLTYLLGKALGLPARAAVLAAILLGLSSGFAFWAVAGLETPVFTLLLLAALLLFVRGGQDRLVAGLFVVLAITRTEAPALFVPLVVLRILKGRRAGLSGAAALRAALPLLVTFALPYALFFAARAAYFGHLFPNPIYFKAGAGLSGAERSVLVPFAATWWPALAAALAGCWLLRGRLLVPAALVAAALPIYATAKSDLLGATSTMAFYDRFLLPVLPCLLLAAAAGVVALWERAGKLVAAAALLVVIGWEVANPLVNPQVVGTLAISQEEGVSPSVEELAGYVSGRFAPTGRVLLGDVGLLGARYAGPVDDLFGLNDYRYTLAHHRDITAYVNELLASRPEVIVLCAEEGPDGLTVSHTAEQLVLDDPRFRAGWVRAESFRSGINPWAYVVFERAP